MQEVLKIAYAFTNLLKKTIEFEWTDKCQKAFQELRHRLTVTPILTFLMESKEYTVYSYASKNVLGCVLMQEDKVIAYPSRQLNLRRKITLLMIWS